MAKPIRAPMIQFVIRWCSVVTLMVFKNGRRNKALINERKLYSWRTLSCDVLTCYNFLYGIPGRGYLYVILYGVIYSSVNLGIQMIVTPPPPFPPPPPIFWEKKPSELSTTSSFDKKNISVFNFFKEIVHRGFLFLFKSPEKSANSCIG